MTSTEIILVQIRSMGYVVKVFKINGTVEMHAVDLPGDADQRSGTLVAGSLAATIKSLDHLVSCHRKRSVSISLL
jgi:hypothetical protein